jgi:2-haloacid dehalogenase
MVASHPWDVFGALQAGLQAAYVRRPGCEAYPSFLPLQPQMVVSDFSELAETLAGLGQ